MGERSGNGSWGIARIFTFAFGVIFVAVALTELITQDTLTPVLEYSAALNALHWSVGVLLLIACTAGDRISRPAAGATGVLFAVATIWFLLDRTAFSALLDYPYPQQHPLPGSYIAFYGVTALAGLLAWLAPMWLRRRSRGRSGRASAPSGASATS